MPPPATPPPSRAYASFVLAMLVVMYALNYLDRYILAMLIQPIKEELGTSDTMMGFLTGPAFAVLYATAGMPIAHLADRASRVGILTLSLAVWSACTAVSGLARNSFELAAARIGVGIGEAGGTAPAHSLISDYFPAGARTRALGVFQLGVYLGQFLGIYAGGILAVEIGWRWTFAAAGLPGLAFALLLRVLVREPERGRLDAQTPERPGVPVSGTLRLLWGLPSFRWLTLGAGIAGFAGTGFGAWIPTLFVRVHEMSLADVGRSYAWYNAPAAMAGTILAGWLADRLGVRDPRWMLRVAALSLALVLPFLILICVWPEPRIAMLFAVPAGLLGGGWAPACYSAAQNLALPRMRAIASSFLVLSLTLLGQGAGPLVVGMLNDWLEPRLGPEAIRASLVGVLATSLVGAAMIERAGRLLGRDIARLRAVDAAC